METKRILVNNEQLAVSTILNPVVLDVDLDEETQQDDDIDLLGDFEL